MKTQISNLTRHLSGNSFKAQCSRSAIALTAGNVTERGMRLVRTMFLAKLLLRSDIGIMALVVMVSQLLEALTQVGVKQSVIQNKKGGQEEYLNTAWWFQTVRGIGLYVVSFLLAPAISGFYDEPRMLWMLRIAFLGILFNGLISPRAHVLEKNLKFGKAVLLVQGSGLLGTLITICLVCFWRDVWAIVIGITAETFLRSLMSFVFCPFRPRFSIDRESYKELLKYARRMLGIPILTWFAFQADIVVLGKLVSKELVGIYFAAFQLARMPRELFTRVVGQLLLPAFSKKQDDSHILGDMVLTVVRGTAVFTSPLMAFFIICSGAILCIAYKPEYVEVSVPFCLLCLVILLRIQGVIISSLYLAIGQPHFLRRFVGLRAAVILLLIYPGVVIGQLTGAAAVVLIAEAVGFLGQIFWLQKLTTLRARDYIYCLFPASWISAVVILPVGLWILFGPESIWAYLMIGGLFLAIAYVIGLFFYGISWQRPHGTI